MTTIVANQWDSFRVLQMEKNSTIHKILEGPSHATKQPCWSRTPALCDPVQKRVNS